MTHTKMLIFLTWVTYEFFSFCFFLFFFVININCFYDQERMKVLVRKNMVKKRKKKKYGHHKI